MSSETFYLILASTFVHASWNLLLRRAKGCGNILFLSILLSSVLLLPVVLFYHFNGVKISAMPTEAQLLLLATGAFTAIYLYFLSRAYEIGEISTVYPIVRGISVSFATLGGLSLLGESLSLEGTLGIASVMTGIFLIGFSKGLVAGKNKMLLFALIVGLASGSYTVVDKFAVEYMDPFLLLACIYPQTALFVFPFLRKSIDFSEIKKNYVPILAIGIGGPGAYFFVLTAFQSGQLSYIAAMREFSVVLGSIAGWVFFKEHISKRKAFGLLAITVGLFALKVA